MLDRAQPTVSLCGHCELTRFGSLLESELELCTERSRYEQELCIKNPRKTKIKPKPKALPLLKYQISTHVL